MKHCYDPLRVWLRLRVIVKIDWNGLLGFIMIILAWGRFPALRESEAIPP